MKIKNILVTLLLIVSGLQTAWAQQGMQVWNNGKFDLYFISNVDSVRFVNLVSDIFLSEDEIAMEVGDTKKLIATVYPIDADDHAVTWESNNNNVAEVDERGSVTAKGNGTCVIICRAADGSGVKAECKVTVVGGTTPDIITNPLDGHEWVDLGLPSGTLWATCNVGASTPSAYGDFFAWGETATKNDYNESSYRYVLAEGRTELEPTADAATVNWSSNWQMPSAEQCDELINTAYTKAEWNNNEKVWVITSKFNGNSICLPMTGFYYGSSRVESGSFFWSRSVGSGDNYGYCLMCNDNGVYSRANWMIRAYGATVRPVVKGTLPSGLVRKIELSETSITLQPGQTKSLTVTVLPENAENKEVLWESTNTSVAIVANNGVVVALANGTTTIICNATDGSGVKAECWVSVGADAHEYVDLGLPSGTLWATCNVGANNPEEYGNYFAWGETQPKELYTANNYRFADKVEEISDYNGYPQVVSVTKYCTDSRYGTVDGKTELDPDDDAATVNWGWEWQTPSSEQFAELINKSYTTTTWTTQNGVHGTLIKSKMNGKNIFLPAAGSYGNFGDGKLNDVGSRGEYYTRSISDFIDVGFVGIPVAGYYFSYFEDYGTTWHVRFLGLSIRPVRKQ